VLLRQRDLAGVHFTGSTAVFNTLWRSIGARVGEYRGYPRIVGETGGKGFIPAHASADVPTLASAIVRGGFEYQGQKCSAASRVFVPASLWPELRDRVVATMRELRTGDVADFRTFMGAVIDRRAYRRITGYLAAAREEGDRVIGGESDEGHGFFIEPAMIETTNPDSALLREEIFGPVVTANVYQDTKWVEVLDLIDKGSPYGLTGAVFATDRRALRHATAALRYTAGNLYLNDKPTGAVVGQQPFGGGRASGTNDKEGSKISLLRWASHRAVKESFAPSADVRYPSMRER
jgi:1-pyrroline-5-carboxylate dehydrogenase